MDSVNASRLGCIKCGYNLTGVAIGGTCPECGESIETSLAGRGGPLSDAPKTSGLATTSMILGICSLPMMLACGFVGLPLPIVAVVMGHIARKQIRAQPGLQGDGMALSGLIMGYISATLMAIFLIIFIFVLGGVG